MTVRSLLNKLANGSAILSLVMVVVATLAAVNDDLEMLLFAGVAFMLLGGISMVIALWQENWS